MTQTIDVWSDTRGKATCRGPNCRARITWVEVVESGRRMPFTGDPVALRMRDDPASGRLIETLDLAESHWAACPDWLTFKRAKRAAGGP